MSSVYLVSSSENEPDTLYETDELPAALKHFFGLVETAESAELRWSS